MDFTPHPAADRTEPYVYRPDPARTRPGLAADENRLAALGLASSSVAQASHSHCRGTAPYATYADQSLAACTWPSRHHARSSVRFPRA